MSNAKTNEFAGCDEQQSGQRFLDGSAPRLIQHVMPCETAGGDGDPLVWDTYPLPAGKDKKPSWGFGGEAPEFSALCADGLSSLDSLTNNRNNVPDYYRRPRDRGKFCGRMSISGIDPKTGRRKFRRLNCNCWTCSYCGPRKARTARAAIRRVAESLNLRYFLTLTLDPKRNFDRNFSVPYLRECFNKFRLYLRRLFGTAPNYICVLEFTKAGVPHLHILFDRYIPQKWISNTWGTLGGGRIVFIKQVTVQKVARYLSKYLTKDLILSAPKGVRRITTARSIKLFPKFNSGITWELLRESIYRALENRRDVRRQQSLFQFITLEFDEQHFLKAFEIHEDGCIPAEERKVWKG